MYVKRSGGTYRLIIENHMKYAISKRQIWWEWPHQVRGYEIKNRFC